MDCYHSWWEEKRSAYLYGIMAQFEKNWLHKKLFLALQIRAEQQAARWESKFSQGQWRFIVDYRTRLVAWLMQYLGVGMMHSILSAMKIRGMSVFTQYHNEYKHTNLSSAHNLRAAVFGINDGLISNMSLLLGLVGAHVNQQVILFAGIAGLFAGACSMGAGEYISVRSQREIFEYQIALEQKELEEYPEEEQIELSLIYQARGMKLDAADQLAKLLIENPETGLNVLSREELGINPENLVSPIGALFFSFLSFSMGAVIPLLPFLWGNTLYYLGVSILLTLIALFGTGVILSLFTNKNPIYLGLRMLCIGTLAGGLTFMIGQWLKNRG